MMSRKHINIEHSLYWSAYVIIDEEIAMPTIIQMVDFWANSKYDLQTAKGDYLLAFCRNLSAYLYRLACEGKNEDYAMNQTEEEGWCQLTPEFGFSDLKMDEVTYSHEDFNIDIA